MEAGRGPGAGGQQGQLLSMLSPPNPVPGENHHSFPVVLESPGSLLCIGWVSGNTGQVRGLEIVRGVGFTSSSWSPVLRLFQAGWVSVRLRRALSPLVGQSSWTQAEALGSARRAAPGAAVCSPLRLPGPSVLSAEQAAHGPSIRDTRVGPGRSSRCYQVVSRLP